MIAIGVGDDMLKDLEILLTRGSQSRRMITHEAMTKMIKAAVIDRREIPFLCGEQFRGDIVNRHRLCDDLAEHVQSLVLGLIHLVVIRHECAEKLAGKLHRVHAQLAKRVRERLGMNRPSGQRRILTSVVNGLLEMI